MRAAGAKVSGVSIADIDAQVTPLFARRHEDAPLRFHIDRYLATRDKTMKTSSLGGHGSPSEPGWFSGDLKLDSLVSQLSHDLNNNLQSIDLQLESLKEQLRTLQTGDEHSMLENAQQSIRHTANGMLQLLTFERLRKANSPQELKQEQEREQDQGA